MFTFNGLDALALLVRKSSWAGNGILVLGVTYDGDYSSTSGFCNLSEDPDEPDPPEVCDALDTCCSTYLQDQAWYETCLVDGHAECCEGSGACNLYSLLVIFFQTVFEFGTSL